MVTRCPAPGTAQRAGGQRRGRRRVGAVACAEVPYRRQRPGLPVLDLLLGSVAKAIVYTWVFVGTGGSLLTVTLLHAAWNTSEVFLPLFPATTGDSRAWSSRSGCSAWSPSCSSS